MTSAEFKAWYEGARSILKESGILPTYNDHEKFAIAQLFFLIDEKIKILNEVPTPYPIFLACHWPFPDRGAWWTKLWPQAVLSATEERAYQQAVADAERYYDTRPDGRYAAWYALGRHEAAEALRKNDCLQSPENRV